MSMVDPVKINALQSKEVDAKAMPDADAQKQFRFNVYQGRLEDCRRALQACPALARGSVDGETPLHTNAKSFMGSYLCVDLLLEHGADPNALDSNGLNPLGVAMTKGPTPQGATWVGIRTMIDHGADIWIKHPLDPLGLSSLHIATKKSANDAVFFLGTLGGAELIESQSSGGRRALHIAVESGLTSTVNILLKLGADSRALMDDGQCPIQLAMKRSLNADQTVLFLIAYGGRTENAWPKYKDHSMPMAAAACGDMARLLVLKKHAEEGGQPWSEQDLVRVREAAHEHQKENILAMVDAWMASASIESAMRMGLPKRLAGSLG